MSAAEHVRKVPAALLRARYDHGLAERCSAGGADLIARLLVTDPAGRASAAECLKSTARALAGEWVPTARCL